MTVSVASAQADATKGKNEAQQEIAQSNSDLRIKQAEAARTAQVAENVAKADVQRQTFDAETKAQESRAAMQRKQQYAEQVVPAEIAKEAVIVNAQAEAQRVTIAADAEGKKILTIKQAEGLGIKSVLEGRAEGFRQLVAAAGGSANEAVIVLVADQLPNLVDSQMKAISNLKIDKVIVWGGGGENEKGGISHLLKDLITGLPPVTDLAKAAGVQLPPVLGRVESPFAETPSEPKKG